MDSQVRSHHVQREYEAKSEPKEISGAESKSRAFLYGFEDNYDLVIVVCWDSAMIVVCVIHSISFLRKVIAY